MYFLDVLALVIMLFDSNKVSSAWCLLGHRVKQEKVLVLAGTESQAGKSLSRVSQSHLEDLCYLSECTSSSQHETVMYLLVSIQLPSFYWGYGEGVSLLC